MFERFTERACQVVVLAQDAARALKHNYIGTEHILLAIVRENEGVAARILLDFDADADAIRDRAVALLVTGWLLFGAALGVGILVGWAIRGH